MFAWYRQMGVSLLEKLAQLYSEYGYCLNTLHSFTFEGSAGFGKMQEIMRSFRGGVREIGGKKVENTIDYAPGLDGLPKSDVMKFLLDGNCSVVVRPSGTEPKLKVYISVSAKDRETAEAQEAAMAESLSSYFA